MLINIMVATVAANPAVALKPRDHLVPVGFRLRHGHRLMRKYIRIYKLKQPKNATFRKTPFGFVSALTDGHEPGAPTAKIAPQKPLCFLVCLGFCKTLPLPPLKFRL